MKIKISTLIGIKLIFLITIFGFATVSHAEELMANSDVIQLTTTSSMDPDIAVYKNNVHIVWSDKRDSNWEIYYKKSIDNGITWENDTRLTYTPRTSYPGSSYPVIAVNGENIYIVWQDDNNGNFEIYFKFSNDNGDSWSNDIRLTYTYGLSIHPDIAVIGNNIHIVWMENYRNIFYINSIDGGKTWSNEVELASTSLSSWCPSIEASSDFVHVAWRNRYEKWVPELGEKGEILYMRSSDSGQSWNAPITLALTYTYGWETVWKPGLAVSGNNVHIVYENNSRMTDPFSLNSDIYYLRSPDNGATWNDQMRLTFLNDSNHPTISAHGDFVHIAWRAWRKRVPNALNYLISKNDGSTWSQVIPLSTSLKVFVYLAMAATDDFAHTVWYDSVGNFPDSYPYSIFYYKINVYNPINITLDIDPDIINLKSNGKWATAYIELAECYDINDINVSTIKLKPGEMAVDPTVPATIGDYDGDGISDLMVKFDRANIITHLSAGDGVLTVTGKLFDGTDFEGNETIRVIK